MNVHVEVKKLAAEKLPTISDQEFFSSRILSKHFEDIARAQTRRYDPKARISVWVVWKPELETRAQTDNQTIFINAGHPQITNLKTRTERYDGVTGLFTHELGHILWTDFRASTEQVSRLKAGCWWPTTPSLTDAEDIRNAKEIEQYINAHPHRVEALCNIFHHIRNVIEDGYIEEQLHLQYPGNLGRCLKWLRDTEWVDVPSVAGYIQAETDVSGPFCTISNMILSYVIYGKIKLDTPTSDFRVQAFYSLLELLDKALQTHRAASRLAVSNEVFIRLWGFIKPILDEIPERAKEAERRTEGLRQVLIHIGISSEGSGNTGALANTTGSQNQTQQEQRALVRTALKNVDNPASCGTDTDQVGPQNSDTEAGQDGQQDSDTEANQYGQQDSDTEADQDGQQNSDTEVDQDGQQDSDTEADQKSLQNEGASGIGNCDDSILEALLEKVAEQQAQSELEQQRTKQLNQSAQELAKDADYSLSIVRAEVTKSMETEYQNIAHDLILISRSLQRSIRQQLLDKRAGGKITGLLLGRRLDSPALYRQDGKVFYKRNLPTEAPTLAVGLLLDESGSMCGLRSEYAKKTAIVLLDFCRSLSIPVMVYGHNSSSGHVSLYSYAEFTEIDGNDRYRLMGISSRNCNRDGAALRYVADRLSRRSEDIRLLILVSDGLPYDIGYSDQVAKDDLQAIIRQYRRKGLVFAAAAIGDDREQIEEIYGDSFMDISDLRQLPQKITQLVKRYIRI